ncbi:putative AP2 protein [Hordeum vulgare]|nr:putative AP2 protein [Hordeum vulgare]
MLSLFFERLVDVVPRMPLRPRSSLGFRDVCHSPFGMFCAKIHSSDMRLGLGTFETVHGTTCAYDAAAWRLQRPRTQMNFQDVFTCQDAEDLAPPCVWSPSRTATCSAIGSATS